MRIEKREMIFLSQKEADTWTKFSQILEGLKEKVKIHMFLTLSVKLLVICQICGKKWRILNKRDLTVLFVCFHLDV